MCENVCSRNGKANSGCETIQNEVAVDANGSEAIIFGRTDTVDAFEGGSADGGGECEIQLRRRLDSTVE